VSITFVSYNIIHTRRSKYFINPVIDIEVYHVDNIAYVESVEEVKKGAAVLTQIKDFLLMDMTSRRLKVEGHQGYGIKQDRFNR